MRVIVHLSDLHFGAVDERILDPLREAICSVKPDLIAVSGDLTQRALARQFRRARAFLDTLPFPRLVVPGNHDVPLFDIAARFVEPMRRFRRLISSDLAPVFVDDELVAVGLNTARSWSFRHGPGRVNQKQIVRATAQLTAAPRDAVKVVVTHHPFDLPPGLAPHHLVGRAKLAMSWLSSARVDLFLSGHLHVRHIGHTGRRYGTTHHSALVVQAGTVSLRGRGELNSFNVLRTSANLIAVDYYVWHPTERRFRAPAPDVFERGPDGWRQGSGSDLH